MCLLQIVFPPATNIIFSQRSPFYSTPTPDRSMPLVIFATWPRSKTTKINFPLLLLLLCCLLLFQRYSRSSGHTFHPSRGNTSLRLLASLLCHLNLWTPKPTWSLFAMGWSPLKVQMLRRRAHTLKDGGGRRRKTGNRAALNRHPVKSRPFSIQMLILYLTVVGR